MFDHLVATKLKSTRLQSGNLFRKRKSLWRFCDHLDLGNIVLVYSSLSSLRDQETKIVIVLSSLNYHWKRSELMHCPVKKFDEEVLDL